MLPRSKALTACCRYYCEHCSHDPQPLDVGCDMHTNGELRLLRELAPHLHTVLDVGANVGDWTSMLLALNPTAQIHAFEPCVSAYDKLSRRGFGANVTLHQVALSSSAGPARLQIFGDASGLNSLHNRYGLEDAAGLAPATRSEEVQLETVDAFCSKISLPCIDLMKIDTEGHEIDVLQGSRASLAAGVIRRVQFEYGGTYIDSRRLLKDAFDIFADLDFVIFLIVPDGLAAYPRYDQRLENFRYNNLVALHRDTLASTPSASKALQLKRLLKSC